MKKIARNWGAVTVLLALAGATGFSGCSHHLHSSSTSRACCAIPSREQIGGSIYQPDLELTSDLGVSRSLSSFRGKPAIWVMFFTSCELVCPVTLEEIERLDASIDTNLRGGVAKVLVSLDPRRDTVQRLQAFRREHHLSSTDWHLLRAGPEVTAMLAARLGVNYAETTPGRLVHSTAITLVDGEGNIAARETRLQGGGENLLRALEALTARTSRTQIFQPRRSEN